MKTIYRKIKNNNTKNNIVYLIIGLLFIAYFTILSINSRPHFDDLGFITTFADGTSICNYVSDYYLMESGAFASYFINGLIFNRFISFQAFRFFPILFILLGITICCYCCRVLIKDAKLWNIIIFTTLLYSIYIFTTIDQSVPYWLCAMGYCLNGPELLLLFTLLTKKKKKNIESILVLVLSLRLGGGGIAFSCIVLAVFCLVFIYRLIQCKIKKDNIIRDERAKVFIISFLIFLVAFIINIKAPGYYRRLNGGEIDLTARPDDILGFVHSSLSSIATFLYFSIFNIPYLLSTVAISVCFGKLTKINIKEKKKVVIISSALYIIMLICFSWPAAYIFGSFGYQRPWTGLCFLTYLYATTIGLCIVPHTSLQNRIYQCLSIACCAFLTCAISIHLISDTEESREYAKEYDSRMEYLESIPKNYSGLVTIPILSQPYTTDMKYRIRHFLNDSYSQIPELYIIPDNAISHSERAFAEYFKLSATININGISSNDE